MNKFALLLFAIVLAGLPMQPASAARDGWKTRQVETEQDSREETREERRAKKREAVRERREQRREERRQAESRNEQTRREVRTDRSGGGAERAARIARGQNGGGRVLSVNPEGSGYRVRLLKDGEVRSYWIQGD